MVVVQETLTLQVALADLEAAALVCKEVNLHLQVAELVYQVKEIMVAEQVMTHIQIQAQVAVEEQELVVVVDRLVWAERVVLVQPHLLQALQ